MPRSSTAFRSFRRASRRTAASSYRFCSSSVSQMIGDFYTAAMDTAAIEAQGFSALDPLMKMIGDIQSTDDLMKTLAHLHKHSISAGFSLWIDSSVTAQARCSMPELTARAQFRDQMPAGPSGQQPRKVSRQIIRKDVAVLT